MFPMAIQEEESWLEWAMWEEKFITMPEVLYGSAWCKLRWVD